MSTDFGPTGIDPDWYDSGVGSEAWKQKREGERAAVHERIEQDRESVLTQLKARIAELEADIQRLQALLVCSSCATDKPGGPGVAVICRECVAELQALVDSSPRQPNGEHLQCPLCRQYLDYDGTCPEGCGNIGQWLSIYEKAQDAVDKNATLQAIVDTLPKCSRLVDGVLVCDKAVTPGMTIWYWLSDGEPGLPSENSMLISCKLHSFHRTATLTEMDGWLQFRYCFDSREAAEAARNER